MDWEFRDCSGVARPGQSISTQSDVAAVCRDRPLPDWEFRDYLGWQDQGDGRLAYGVFVQNGRLKGETKKALRQVTPPLPLRCRLSKRRGSIAVNMEPRLHTGRRTSWTGLQHALPNLVKP